MDLGDIHNRHAGQSCAVLGGGPSLPADLRELPEGIVYIGVNQHALILQPAYIVFRDDCVWPSIAEHPATKIAPHEKFPGTVWSGICPDFGFTGPEALWVAEYMGFERIYLAGMGLYQDGRRYWHSLEDKSQPEVAGLGIAQWRRARDHLKHPERVRAVSGPLVNVFGGIHED